MKTKKDKVKYFNSGNKKSGVQKQRERTAKLFDKCKLTDKKANVNTGVFDAEKVKSLAAKHSELIDDFSFVREINTVTSIKFDEITELFPRLIELDYLIDNLRMAYEGEGQDFEEEFILRLKMLKSFRKVVEALEKTSDKIRPKSYEETVEEKEVK